MKEKFRYILFLVSLFSSVISAQHINSEKYGLLAVFIMTMGMYICTILYCSITYDEVNKSK